MDKKKLLALVAILAVLVALVVMKQAQQGTVPRIPDDRFADMAPAGLSRGDITALKVYSGAKPDEPVRLMWDRDASQWRIASLYDAPALADEVNGYLDGILGVSGEFRAEVPSEDRLADYQLGEDGAFHVEAYTDGEEPAYHLLVGKAPTFNQVFVRRAGDMTVYVANYNPRREAGVFSDEPDAAPTGTNWLDKKVVDVAEANITQVELVAPDKRVVFKKESVPVVDPAADAEAATEIEAEGETPGEPATETKWVVAEGGPGTAFKETGLEAMLRSFAPLNAQTVVDPAKRAEWGLDAPGYVLRLTVDGQDEPIVLEGARPEPDQAGYVQLGRGETDLVYEVSNFNFGRVFGKGSDLFELPTITLNTNEVNRVEVTQPEGNFVIGRQDGNWVVESPQTTLGVQAGTVDGVVRAFGTLRSTDYADPAAQTGLAAAARTVTVHMSDGSTHSMQVGARAPAASGYYALLDNSPVPVAIAETDYSKIFVEPSNLFRLRLYEFGQDEIRRVTVQQGGVAYTLAREGATWSIETPEGWFTVNRPAVLTLLSTVANLQAERILFGQNAMTAPVAATVEFELESGERHSIDIAEGGEGEARPMLVSGQSTLFTVSAVDAEDLTPSLDEVKGEEAAEAPAPVPSVDEAAGAPEAEPAGPADPPMEEPAAEAADVPTPEAAPVEPAPAAPAPEAAAPAEEVPVEAAPAEPVPAVSAEEEPVAEVPADTPVEAAPDEGTPAAEAPAEETPANPAPGSADESPTPDESPGGAPAPADDEAAPPASDTSDAGDGSVQDEAAE